jgi:hypothetical protein
VTGLGIAGTALQLLGAAVTALGLLYAWNRASGRFDQWRQSVRSTLAELRAKVTRPTAESIIIVAPTMRVTAEMLPPTVGTPESRLLRVEQQLAELPGQTKKQIEAIEAAIDEKLAEFDATGKGFAVRDIYWTLGGIGLQVVGYVLSLISQLPC